MHAHRNLGLQLTTHMEGISGRLVIAVGLAWFAVLGGCSPQPRIDSTTIESFQRSLSIVHREAPRAQRDKILCASEFLLSRPSLLQQAHDLTGDQYIRLTLQLAQRELSESQDRLREAERELTTARDAYETHWQSLSEQNYGVEIEFEGCAGLDETPPGNPELLFSIQHASEAELHGAQILMSLRTPTRNLLINCSPAFSP